MSRPKLSRVTARARARRGPDVEVVDHRQVVRGCQWLLLKFARRLAAAGAARRARHRLTVGTHNSAPRLVGSRKRTAALPEITRNGRSAPPHHDSSVAESLTCRASARQGRQPWLSHLVQNLHRQPQRTADKRGRIGLVIIFRWKHRRVLSICGSCARILTAPSTSCARAAAFDGSGVGSGCRATTWTGQCQLREACRRAPGTAGQDRFAVDGDVAVLGAPRRREDSSVRPIGGEPFV